MRQLATKRPARLLAVLIGPIILIIILLRADLAVLATLLGDAKPGMVLAAVGAVVAFHWLKAVRWIAILRGQGIVLKLLNGYLMYGAGLLLGLITPGRVGDFAKIWYIRKLGYGYGRSSVSVLLDRLLDLLVLALVGLVALVWYAQTSLAGSLPLLALVTLPLLGFAVLVIWFTRWSPGELKRSRLSALVHRYVPTTWLSQVAEFRSDWKAMPSAAWSWTLATTVVGWLLFWSAIYLLATSMDLPLSYWQTTAFFCLSSIAGYLPISIAGIGTREAVMAGLFEQVGLSLEQAVAFALLIFSMNLVIVVEGSIGLITQPLPLGSPQGIKSE